ncbi:MAG TPA: response regulator [Geobacteraceae bacterium]|nr:response regulator [Geobacteraceae bacterium]
MSLVGNLEDLGLGEILQIVSLSRKSGILTLCSRGREGRISFRQGHLIRATSPTYQEGLGEVLLRKGLIDQDILRRALSIQEGEGFAERLGTILIKYFQISSTAIEEVVREQIENVVYSLFDWTDGTFGFELRENVEAFDNIEMDPMQFLLEQGLNSQFLAIEGARIIDERHHLEEETCSALPVASEAPLPGENIDLSFNLLEPAGLPATRCLPAITDDRPILLIVDDNAAVHEALVPHLENGGYAVHPFARGEDAITGLAAIYRDGGRPVVLADVIMPRMDGTGMLGGVELLDLIKDNFPDIHVIAMTDFHNSEAEWNVRRMRFPLIMKPRQNEIGDPASLQPFVGRLLAELGQLRGGRGQADLSDKVNLGDELRMEIGEEPAPAFAPVVQSTGLAQLRGMLEELHNPSLGGGIILLALRFAAEFMNRAVIFIIKEDEIMGLGQFGLGEGDGLADSAVREMRIPMGESSLFSQVIEVRMPLKIKPADNRWNRYLMQKLGGAEPVEVFVGPIVSEDKVVALLYGDNLPDKKPIGDTESLEIFLSQAGMAMEKAILQRRLMEKDLEGM